MQILRFKKKKNSNYRIISIFTVINEMKAQRFDNSKLAQIIFRLKMFSFYLL